MIDPEETLLERWVLHEANEVYNYWSCVQQEPNASVRAVWERFLDYELGHLQVAIDCFQRLEKRDVAALLPASFPDPVGHRSHRAFVRQVLAAEAHLRAVGEQIVDPRVVPESEATLAYRARINSAGSPSRLALDAKVAPAEMQVQAA
jgi:hypothetical protein